MISCDTVYQRVLALANKEQRGYITPQEFNLFANMAQMEIFEQYFYDLNQYHRLPNNGMEYSDILELLNEKISIFKIQNSTGVAQTTVNNVPAFILPSDMHRLGTVNILDANGVRHEAIEVKYDKLLILQASPLTAPSLERPVYYRRENRRIGVVTGAGLGSGNATVEISYIRRPLDAAWGYVIVNEKALYDATRSSNFEIHHSDMSELTFRIATYCGITMKQPQFTQVTGGMNISKQQQEKL